MPDQLLDAGPIWRRRLDVLAARIASMVFKKKRRKRNENENAFADLVIPRFSFLVRDFGFELSRVASSPGYLVEYRKGFLAVAVAWYKGDTEVGFSLDLACTPGHPVFRPYISRQFEMWEIVYRIDSHAYKEAYRGLPKVHPTMTLEQVAVVLDVDSKFMTRYCRPILEGDFSILETITLERRGLKETTGRFANPTAAPLGATERIDK